MGKVLEGGAERGVVGEADVPKWKVGSGREKAGVGADGKDGDSEGGCLEGIDRGEASGMMGGDLEGDDWWKLWRKSDKVSGSGKSDQVRIAGLGHRSPDISVLVSEDKELVWVIRMNELGAGRRSVGIKREWGEWCGRTILLVIKVSFFLVWRTRRTRVGWRGTWTRRAESAWAGYLRG